jgi:voltage-gated potassium channel
MIGKPGTAKLKGSGTRVREQGQRLRVLAAVTVFFAFLLVATVGYYLIEGDYTWLEALYMTVITVAMVGYHVVGEGKEELSDPGKLWTIFVIGGGLCSGAVAMSLIVAAVVEGRVRRILGRRQLQQRIAALSGHVVVCGYGRMGQSVARQLREAGRQVVVVDDDAARTTQAEADGMLYLLGDAQDEAALIAAGVQRAQVLIATLPDDAASVFVTLTARSLSPHIRVIARAQQATTQDKLAKAGASRVICPMIIGANRIADVVLRPAMVDFVEMAQKGVNLELDQLTLREESGMVGRTLRELGLPSRVGAMVVAVRRPDGEAVYNPGPDLALAAGDTLVLIGKKGVASAIQGLGNSASKAGRESC